MRNLQIIEHKSIRVLTTQQLAEGYETEPKAINNNFNRNIDRYEAGKHFYCLEGEDLRGFKTIHQFEESLKINKLYLWTEKGALLHAKSLNTDKAWAVYDMLVETYFRAKEKSIPTSKPQNPPKTNLSSVNNAVKIITPFLRQAKISEDIQLLTIKGIYAKADIHLPIDISADKIYYDTKQIARHLGIYTKTGKPAYHAIAQIIKELDISAEEIKEVWETNGSWQGVVKKYSEAVIDKTVEWLKENECPVVICGVGKNYNVTYRHAPEAMGKKSQILRIAE